jgi:hypothetical protein
MHDTKLCVFRRRERFRGESRPHARRTLATTWVTLQLLAIRMNEVAPNSDNRETGRPLRIDIPEELPPTGHQFIISGLRIHSPMSRCVFVAARSKNS